MNEAAALLDFLVTNVGLPGKPVIAGGYARDQILGTKPRDIDVFILNAEGKSGDVASNLRRCYIPHTVNAKDYNGIQTFDPAVNFVFMTAPVQIICTPCASATDVVGTFDYNICQFWLDDVFSPVGPVNDLVMKSMCLRHTRTPWSSLRRGILMADRFGFEFHAADRRKLIEALHVEWSA